MLIDISKYFSQLFKNRLSCDIEFYDYIAQCISEHCSDSDVGSNSDSITDLCGTVDKTLKFFGSHFPHVSK